MIMYSLALGTKFQPKRGFELFLNICVKQNNRGDDPKIMLLKTTYMQSHKLNTSSVLQVRTPVNAHARLKV